MFNYVTIVLAVCLLSGCTGGPRLAAVSREPYLIYLPRVEVGSDCYRTAEAAEFARRLITDDRQRRRGMRCSQALAAAARQRAESMAAHGYVGHCEPAGVCANQTAIDAGCRLPAYYGPINNIETIGAGTPDGGLMYDLLTDSGPHAQHLFGLNGFFQEQLDLGIAYTAAPGSRYGYYWVILIAVCQDEAGAPTPTPTFTAPASAPARANLPPGSPPPRPAPPQQSAL